MIYTTNSIEAVHRQFQKLTKTKSGFPNEDSLLKLLYLRGSNCQQEVDDAYPELEHYPVPIGHLL